MNGPLLAALQAQDGELLQPELARVLKADIGPIRLQQTAGERFTGGKSTPVWKLSFTARRGDRERETCLVAKWVRPTTAFRRSSYANERQFYAEAAGLVRRRCRLPHLLLFEDGSVTGLGFCFLFDDLTVEFPLHPESLDVRTARACLRWLATFHAHFWEADAAGCCFPRGMLPCADYWGLDKGDNEDRLETVAAALTNSSKALKTHGVWDIARSLGPRLHAAARPLDGALRKFRGFVRHRTLLHGDFKAANLFLRISAEDESDYEAAVVDFEFSGPGLVAVDLANFFFPDMRMNLLVEEAGLLRFYHEQLTEQLEELAAGGEDFTLPLLMTHYAAARCDYMRYMLGRGWTACCQADAQLLSAVNADLERFDAGDLLLADGYEAAITAAFSATA